MKYLFKDLIIMEQEEEKLPPKEVKVTPPAEAPAELPSEEMGVDEFGMEVEEKTPEEVMKDLGKVYIMKKTYAKLLAISNILDSYSDDKFDDIREKVLETLDIFTVIVDNYDQFKDDVDQLISVFIKFTVKATEELDRLTQEE
ncbi:MAG: hypothetical protein KAS32_03555 [Candidatus Peribacteraceae bacterium]|nr:hypothetical protein [Candidatus Peribacteraceae bacterium]